MKATAHTRTGHILAIALLAVSCAFALPRVAVADETSPTPVTRQIGTSVRGRPILMTSFGSGTHKVLIVGGMHGNEYGASVAQQFANYLAAHPSAIASGTQVDVIVSANPDGRARRKRGNAHGVDLNRNFPTRNWRRIRERGASSGPRRASEPETRALLGVLTGGYDRVIALHSKGGLADYDGPGGLAIARRIASVSALRVVKLSRFRRYRGSLGTYFPERYGKPVVTLELRSPHMSFGLLKGLLAATR